MNDDSSVINKLEALLTDNARGIIYTQHNDTQHNDTQHNDTQHNGTQYERAGNSMLGVVFLITCRVSLS